MVDSELKEAYPLVADYLDALGIDIEKPLETSPLEPDEDGMIEYCVCQYIALGNAADGLVGKVGDVEVGIAASYPATDIQSEHFVIDIYSVRLKWVL